MLCPICEAGNKPKHVIRVNAIDGAGNQHVLEMPFEAYSRLLKIEAYNRLQLSWYIRLWNWVRSIWSFTYLFLMNLMGIYGW